MSPFELSMDERLFVTEVRSSSRVLFHLPVTDDAV